LSERKTVSASKGLFHKDFPFVIPSIYRKVIDEYLVELNLLSNQSSFYVDGLFSYGLLKSFEIFTNGYEPASHKYKILDSLCKSCDIEYSLIEKYSNAILTISKTGSFKNTIDELDSNDNKSIDGLPLRDILNKNNYYSRLHSIGLYEILKLEQEEDSDSDSEGIIKSTLKLLVSLGFCESRADKDLTLYKSNIKRIKEAMELIKITNEESRRKQET